MPPVYKIETGKVQDPSMCSCSCTEFLCLHHVSIHWQDWWSKGEEAGFPNCQRCGKSYVRNRKRCYRW